MSLDEVKETWESTSEQVPASETERIFYTSVEMAIKSPRMRDVPSAKRLLGVLGKLPGGVAYNDLDVLLPDDGW